MDIDAIKADIIQKVQAIKANEAAAETARDALTAKLTQVQGLITDLGTTPTLTKLLNFLSEIKNIIKEGI